jgi:hypothetical protein
MNRKLGRFGK